MKAKFIAVIAVMFMIFLTAIADAKNMIKIGGDVTVNPEEEVNNIIAIGGQITVNGLVENNVAAVGGSIVLTNKAVVRGNVICVGGVIAKGRGSQVYGNITEINSSNISTTIVSAFRDERKGWPLILNVIYLCFFAVMLILALVMAILIPRPLIAISRAIQNNKIKSFLGGFLATLMITPFFFLLIISIIGIILVPFAFAALLLAFAIGFIGVSALSGNFILTKILRRHKKSLVLETILGLILLWSIGWLPYIGWMVQAIAITFGLGGVFLVLFNRRRQSSSV